MADNDVSEGLRTLTDVQIAVLAWIQARDSLREAEKKLEVAFAQTSVGMTNLPVETFVRILSENMSFSRLEGLHEAMTERLREEGVGD